LKILIASSSDIAIPLIENIVGNGQHEFCGLLSNIDKATGRGQSIRSNDLAEWAKNSGVRIYQSGSTNDIAVRLRNVSTVQNVGDQLASYI
jgi:methionyl-tRNA formyltransferase